MNIIDLIAVLPFYIEWVTYNFYINLKFIRVFRVIRLVRIFKLHHKFHIALNVCCKKKMFSKFFIAMQNIYARTTPFFLVFILFSW